MLNIYADCFMSLTLIQGHSGSAEENYLSWGIQTAHDGRLTHDIYADIRFGDLEIVCKACP